MRREDAKKIKILAAADGRGCTRVDAGVPFDLGGRQQPAGLSDLRGLVLLLAEAVQGFNAETQVSFQERAAFDRRDHKKGLDIKRIAYYISAHGYGHAARSTVVLGKLLDGYDVHIKTEIPPEFFRGYLGDGSYEVARQTVDAGCAQGNFVHIDAEKTFANLRRFLGNRPERLAQEANWLRKNRIDLVVSDAPGFPLRAGRDIGIPTLLIANFTWHDIYSRLPGAENHAEEIDILASEYSAATAQFLPQCHIVNRVTANQREIGFISLKGRSRRDDIESALSANLRGKTLVFIYLGLFDASFLEWRRLNDLKDCVFITRDPLKIESDIDNLHVFDERFSYPDLIASADIVCTKSGYSTLASAFHHGKPVITCDRKDFSEVEAVKAFIEKNQVGLILSPDKFNACDWGDEIGRTRQLKIGGKVKLNGELEVIAMIKNLT